MVVLVLEAGLVDVRVAVAHPVVLVLMLVLDVFVVVLAVGVHVRLVAVAVLVGMRGVVVVVVGHGQRLALAGGVVGRIGRRADRALDVVHADVTGARQQLADELHVARVDR